MIRKTPRSGWTVKQIFALAALGVAGVFALGIALSPLRVPTVAVIGDHAGAVRAALGANQAKDATVTIVLLNRWDSLRHLPDIAELCWDACHNKAAPHITLTQMRFGATRKVVIFHLPDFEPDLSCVTSRALTELTALRARAPVCDVKTTRLPVWILPMGLGRIS